MSLNRRTCSWYFQAESPPAAACAGATATESNPKKGEFLSHTLYHSIRFIFIID